MSDEGREHDPLLDAGLEEVLGGRRPPNLAPRIAQAWAVRSGQIASGAWTAPTDFALPPPPNGMAPQNGRGQYAKPIPLSPLPVQPTHPAAATPAAPMAEFVGLARPVPVAGVPVAGVPVAQPTPPPRAVETTPPAGVPAIHDRPRAFLPRDQAGWAPWVVAASLLVAAGIATYTVYKSLGLGDKPIVNPNPIDPPRDNKLPDRPMVVKQDPPKNPKTPRPNRTPGNSPEVLVQGPRSPGPAIQPISEPQVVALIDESLAAAWLDHGVDPADLAGDEEWCRRLFLRTLGRVPTVSESRAFVADASKEKRTELTDKLLTGAEYADELARHWSGAWTTVLVGRTASPELREGLRAYLEQAIRTNKPYDALVTELVTATGPAATGADAGTKGAVDFLLALADKDERAVRTTSRTTHVLLGTQLECARCHEHPFQKVGPDQYWTLNSFFRQMEVQGAGGQRELAKVDFAGDKPQAGDAGDGAVRYLDAEGKEHVAYPRRLDGTAMAKSGRVADLDRRAELAKEIVASPAFGRTLINRLWTQYFGIGFIRPTEQLSPRGEASHPELLARLGEQFAAHGYDLRKAMRWIVASRAFSLSAKPGEIGSSRDQPLAGTIALFSHYYVLPSTSERIDKSLLNLADAARTGRNMAEEKGGMAWLGRKGPDLPRRPETLSIEAPSGAPIGQSVDMSEGGLLDRLGASKLKDADKITHLFLAAFGREPTPRERDAANTLFAARNGDTMGALQDLWWALLHSNEFNGL